MEIRRDSEIFNENGDTSFGLPLVKKKPDVMGTASHYPRTPLMDVKNKHSHGTPGMKPSRKFSMDSSCTSQDVLSQLTMDAPKRQERNAKSRKSCFAVFSVPEDINTCENKTVTVTLPPAIEEEPEVVILQNQVQFGGVSEPSGAPRTSVKNVKSKSVASLYEILKSKDVDARENRTVGVTLPPAIEEEPDMFTLQHKVQFGDVSVLYGSDRTKIKTFKSKSVAGLYETLKSKDLYAGMDRAVGTTLPRALEEEPEMENRVQCGDVSVLNGADRTKIKSCKSKSVANLYEILKSKDLAARVDSPVGPTLPIAIEEEPKMITRQSQTLSHVYGWSTENATSLGNLGARTNTDQWETFTSRSQSPLSLGEPDVGSELTVVPDGTDIRDKDVDPNAPLYSGCQNCCDNSDSNADDGAAFKVRFSYEAKAVIQKTAASVGLPVVSETKKEIGIFETVQLEECPANFLHKTSDASAHPESTDSRLLQDHQYSKASEASGDNPLPSQLTGQSLLAPALSNTPHSSQYVGNHQGQHSSTPKSAGNLSTFQGFVTPHLSSSLDFMNISDSSFQEELQRTNLQDLIQSYLLQNPVPSMDLSPLAEVCDKNQSNCNVSSPDQSFSDLLKSPLVYPCRNQAIMTDAQFGNDKSYNLGADHESELKEGCMDGSINFLGSDSVLFVADKVVDSDVMSASDVGTSYATQDNVDEDVPEINRRDLCDKFKTLDEVQERHSIDVSDNLESSVLNQEINRSYLSENLLYSHLNQMIVEADFPGELTDSQVRENNLVDFPNELQGSHVIKANQVAFNSELEDSQVNTVKQEDFANTLLDAGLADYISDLPDVIQVSDDIEPNQAVFPGESQDVLQSRVRCLEKYQHHVSLDDYAIAGEESEVNLHMGKITTAVLIPDMGACVSEVGRQLSQDGYSGSVVVSSAGQSLCEGSSESLMSDTDKFSASSSTPDAVQASTSVVSHQLDCVSTSVVTDRCRVSDVCVLTDRQNLVNTSMLTDGCLVNDVSVLTDRQNFVNTSMITDGCLVSDVSIMTNMCQGIDVSMITDACQGLDVSMVTDKVDMLEHSVMVIPECQTQETMTERQMMVDTASSMTPLKLCKQGKRLTAEEIRRQHPRIVANQLDTLLATNQRLQKEVDTAAHNRDSLKSVLAEAKTKLASADKQLNEEKDRQGGVISIIEQYHQRTVASLEAALKNKEETIDSLHSELRNVRLKFEEAQGKWTCVSVELQEKCAQLEKFKSEAEDHIADEMKKLKLQFEENNYYHAFLASQQVIREMQAEQEEFVKLFDDIEHSASLQSRLQDLLGPLISESRKVVKDHVSVRDRLTKQNQAMQKQLTSVQTDLEVALSENKDLYEDIQNINDILKRSNENYAELEATYLAAKQDICESQTKVTELNNKIEFGFKIVKDLMTVKADLTDQVSEHQERCSLQTEKLKSAEEEVQRLTQQLERERKMMDAKSEYYEQVIAEHEASKSRLEIYIENLRDTLDSWEVDRDVQSKVIADCEEQLDKQRAKMEEMSNELQSLRKVKAVTQPERDYYQELRNTSKFLEAEKQLYLEALTDCRSRLEAEVELAASNNKLIDALRSNNTELQQSNDQLMSDVQVLEETLSLKSTDIDMSCTAMDNLQERMESVLTSLQQKLGHEVKPDKSARETYFTPSKLASSFPQESSIMTQILSARKARSQMPQSSNASFAQQRGSVLQSTFINHDSSSVFRAEEAERTRLKQNNVQFGALQPRLVAEAESYLSPRSQSFVISQNSRMLTDSKRSLRFSSASKLTIKNQDVSQNRPQTSVRKDLSSLYPVAEQNSVSTPAYAKICSIPSTMDRTLESLARAKGESCGSVSMGSSSLDDAAGFESDSMLAKVQQVDRLFTLILKTADMAQRASELTVKDLKEDMALLEDKLRFQRCQTKDLETELLQKSAQLTSAKSQMQELNARMREKTQSLMTFQDQQHQVTTLEEEKAELNRKVRSLREEVKMLTEQLHEVLQKFDDIKTGQKPEGACVREIVNLKKQNHELVMKFFDERDKNREIGEKAMRRMKILDTNWRKAEAEVKKFDELVEQIRETCISSQAQSTHPVILQVVRLIDGVE